MQILAQDLKGQGTHPPSSPSSRDQGQHRKVAERDRRTAGPWMTLEQAHLVALDCPLLDYYVRGK